MPYGKGYQNPRDGMDQSNPFDSNDDATSIVLGEIGGVMEDEMGKKMIPDYLENKAKPKNMPGGDPTQPGVEFDDDEMELLEGAYGGL